MTGRIHPRPELEDASLATRLRAVRDMIARDPEMPILERLDLFGYAVFPPAGSRSSENGESKDG